MKQIFLLFLITFLLNPLFAQQKTTPKIGIVASYENDSLLKAAGYNCLVENIQKLISPNISEVQFQENLNILENLRLPICALNIFLPSEHMVVGPNVKEDSVLKYVKKVFERTQAAGINLIVWGSSGSRRIPDGFDQEIAEKQFISIARKISELAMQYNIVLALENLNRHETNFINTLDKALEMAKRVDQPNFMVCVDIYHMLKEGEPPSVIEKAEGYLVHCDIAEKAGRTPPGVMGYDFKPYLKALKKVNFKGKIVIEAEWKDLEEQAAPAYQYLQKQIDEVYGE